MIWWLWACERPPLDCDDLEPPAPPSDLPRVEVTDVDRERSVVARGYLLFNEWKKAQSYAMAIDGCGNPWWWAAVSDPDALKVTRVRMSRDGRSVLYGELDRGVQQDRSQIVRVDLASGATETVRTEGAHHDFVELPDGRLAWLAWQTTQNVWFPNPAPVTSDVVVIDGEPTFSILADSGQEPYWTCDHMVVGSYLPAHIEWTHTNSLAVDDGTGDLFLGVRNWDAVLRVSGDGRLVSQLGGLANQFALGPGTRLPRHGHATEIGPDRMLFFDNGNHDARPITSRVAEYAIDEDARRVDEVWSYDLEGYTDYLGDARALPGGNVLIARPAGVLLEVTPEGDVVWRAEVSAKVGRVEHLDPTRAAPLLGRQ